MKLTIRNPSTNSDDWKGGDVILTPQGRLHLLINSGRTVLIGVVSGEVITFKGAVSPERIKPEDLHIHENLYPYTWGELKLPDSRKVGTLAEFVINWSA